MQSKQEARTTKEEIPRHARGAPLAAATRLPYYAWLVVGVICIGVFMAQLDASIVQLALPALRRQFHSSLAAVSWIAIAYPLSFASTLPVFAHLSKMSGRKFWYVAGFVLFAAASALSALTSSLPLLIAFRLLQGMGGGMLGANSMALLLASGPQSKLGAAVGMFAMAQAVGISSGPVVGGVILAAFGWRGIFWITVPFALAGAALGWLLMPNAREAGHAGRFDWRGVLLLLPALILFLVLLSQINALGIESVALPGGALLVAVLLAGFTWLERHENDPLIDLRLFRLPAFAGGAAGVSMSFALLYSMLFLMSFAFIRGREESPIVAGLHLAILPVSLGLMAPVSGNFFERVGKVKTTGAGILLCILGIVLLSVALSKTEYGVLRMVSLALFGAGLGTFIAANSSATVAAVPQNKRGEAGGLINLMRALGSAIGVAAASTVLSWRMQVIAHVDSRTEGPSAAVLTAVRHALWLPAILAVIAAIAASLRNREPLPEAVLQGMPPLAETEEQA